MQLIPTIRCVIFDLDNTLIGIPDTWQYFDGIIQDVVSKDFGFSVPTQEERDLLWRSEKGYLQILKEWGINDASLFWHQFDERDFKKRMRMITEGKLVLYKDVISVLTELRIRKIPLGIVTNTPEFIAKPELEAFQLNSFFSFIIGLGENQEECKPEPIGILKILEMAHVKAEETLYIGDSSIDILAALNAHVIPVYIPRVARISNRLLAIESEKYFQIHSLDEIFDIFSFTP